MNLRELHHFGETTYKNQPVSSKDDGPKTVLSFFVRDHLLLIREHYKSKRRQEKGRWTVEVRSIRGFSSLTPRCPILLPRSDHNWPFAEETLQSHSSYDPSTTVLPLLHLQRVARNVVGHFMESHSGRYWTKTAILRHRFRAMHASGSSHVPVRI